MNKKVLVALAVALLLPAAGWPAAGDGISGVEVGIRTKPGGQTAGTTKTDARGGFSIGDLEPGSYTLVVTIPGGKPIGPVGNAKSFFESRSNVAREGIEQVLRFEDWAYSVSIGGAGVTGGEGTIKIVSPGPRARARGSVSGAQIELELEIAGTDKDDAQRRRSVVCPVQPVC